MCKLRPTIKNLRIILILSRSLGPKCVSSEPENKHVDPITLCIRLQWVCAIIKQLKAVSQFLNGSAFNSAYLHNGMNLWNNGMEFSS